MEAGQGVQMSQKNGGGEEGGERCRWRSPMPDWPVFISLEVSEGAEGRHVKLAGLCLGSGSSRIPLG